MLKIRLSLGII